MPSYCQDVTETGDIFLARKSKFMLAMSGLQDDGPVKYRRTQPLLPHMHTNTPSHGYVSLYVYVPTQCIYVSACVSLHHPRLPPYLRGLLNAVQLRSPCRKAAIQAEKMNMYLQSADVDDHRNLYKKSSVCKKKSIQ